MPRLAGVPPCTDDHASIQSGPVRAHGHCWIELSLERSDEIGSGDLDSLEWGSVVQPGLADGYVHVSPSLETSGSDVARSGRRTVPPSAVDPHDRTTACGRRNTGPARRRCRRPRNPLEGPNVCRPEGDTDRNVPPCWAGEEPAPPDGSDDPPPVHDARSNPTTTSHTPRALLPYRKHRPPIPMSSTVFRSRIQRNTTHDPTRAGSARHEREPYRPHVVLAVGVDQHHTLPGPQRESPADRGEHQARRDEHREQVITAVANAPVPMLIAVVPRQQPLEGQLPGLPRTPSRSP